MSGSVGGEKDVYDEINVTPMLDLAYVLLDPRLRRATR